MLIPRYAKNLQRLYYGFAAIMLIFPTIYQIVFTDLALSFSETLGLALPAILIFIFGIIIFSPQVEISDHKIITKSYFILKKEFSFTDFKRISMSRNQAYIITSLQNNMTGESIWIRIGDYKDACQTSQELSKLMRIEVSDNT